MNICIGRILCMYVYNHALGVLFFTLIMLEETHDSFRIEDLFQERKMCAKSSD